MSTWKESIDLIEADRVKDLSEKMERKKKRLSDAVERVKESELMEFVRLRMKYHESIK